MRRWLNLHQLIFISVMGFLAVVYVIRNSEYAHDDSYITFRYAENWKNGLGLRFNPSEVFYGTTAAGYAVILALLSIVLTSLFDILNPNYGSYFTIPHISVLVSALSCLTIVLVTYLLTDFLKDTERLIAGLLTGICIFSSRLFESSAGHETYAFLGAIFIGCYLIFARQRFLWGISCLSLAATFRPDALVTISLSVLMLYLLKDYGFKNGWKKAALASLLLMGLWFAFVKVNLGSFLPGTMLAKKAQVSIGYWPFYDFQYSSGQIFNYMGLRAILFAGIGSIAFFLSFRNGLRGMLSNDFSLCLFVVFLGQLISYLAYLSFDVTYWPWYGIPPTVGFLSLGLAGWLVMFRELTSLRTISSNTNRSLLMGILFLLGCLAYPEVASLSSWSKGRHTNPHLEAYAETGAFIKAESPNGAVIQMNEPGKLGFMLGPKYKINDELGLVSPGVAGALLEGNYLYLYQKERPDYIVCSWGGKYTLCNGSEIKNEYKLVGEFDFAFWSNTHIKAGSKLYKKISG